MEAYHGTTREAAGAIVESQSIHVSDTPDEWLGRGAYFFQGSIHRAREWAQRHHPDSPAVVCARVKLGHCIDLLDNRWKHPIEAIAEEIESEGPGYRNEGKRHQLDCEIMNRLAEIWEPQTIRAAYHEGEPVEPGSAFRSATHIQLAVREPEKNVLKMTFDGDWP